MKNIYSISQAYAMRPCSIEIGDTVITPPPNYKKPLIKRKVAKIEKILKNKCGEFIPYYVVKDKEDFIMFEFLADSMNVQFY